MRETGVLVLLAALVALTAALQIPNKSNEKIVDNWFLVRQKNVINLLFGVWHKEAFQNENEDYDIALNAHLYNIPEVVKDFLLEYEQGMLSDEQEFTLQNRKILRQTMKTFDLFYNAKDFDTFYKTACWARKHLNSVQFVYVLYVAVYHRSDCKGMVLPPLYDVFPTSFISQEVMHKIYQAQMEGIQSLKVYVNNTGWEDYFQRKSLGGPTNGDYKASSTHVEERISYFREDVGLNDYLAQLSLFYPAWLDQTKYSKISYFRRGELFYYVYQQLFARYSLERYVNGMPKTDILHWDQPIKVGYNPKVTSPGGDVLYPRAFNMIPNSFNPNGVWKTLNFERRIMDSIDAGVVFYKSNGSYVKLPLEEAIETWGNVVWATPEAKEHDNYGNYFQSALDAIGNIMKTGSEDEFVTGALGYPLTAARDPAFFMLLNRLVKMFQHQKDMLPPYTNLAFPGVRIDRMEISELVTFFDRFDFEATNGVPIPAEESYKDYHYIGRQTRLNHMPFTYKLTVSSDRPVDAIVRIFIGPKLDSEDHKISNDDVRTAIVEIDRFLVKLIAGENKIERESKDSTGFIQDKEGLSTLYDRLQKYITTKEPFYVSQSFNCGPPERLILPKGSSEQPVVFYAVVSSYDRNLVPAEEQRQFESQIYCGGSKLYDGRSYGYPFDRRVDYDRVFQVPNIHQESVFIEHIDSPEVKRRRLS